ncbi:hypothetical protein KC726_00300 [Candidatus Woesebacteria bacterium]|nr:hypothetical protein [Candidatus Woesebacteria bacterium]
MGFSLPFGKKSKKEYYFGLQVSYSHITGSIIDVSQDEPTIINHNTLPLTNGIDTLLQDTDNLITDLETLSDVQIQKTIFFLSSSMLDPAERSILEPFNSALKTTSKELDLNPVGYIDVQEAIQQFFLQKQTPNAIVIELERDAFEVYVYKDTNVAFRKRVEQDPANVHSLISVLEQYNGSLPSHIYLYGIDAMTICRKFNEIDLSEIIKTDPKLEVIQDEQVQQLLVQSFFKEIHAQQEEKQEKGELEPAIIEEQTTIAFGFKVDEDVYTPSQIKNSSLSAFQIPSMGRVLETMKSLFSGLPQLNLAQSQIGIVAGVLLLLVGGYFGYEYFLHTATVELTLASENIEETVDITVPVQDTVDKEVLGAVEHVETQQISNELPTTGSRDVGEKATGSVIIHNFNDSAQTISSGTILSYNNLNFVLDADVTVASASSELEGVKTSGKKQGSITADDIGPDYNLEDGAKLTIDGYQSSLYYAIVDGGLSGGTKETIQTISTTDINKLENSIEDKVKGAQTVSNIEPKNNEILLTKLTDVTIQDSTYSGEVGEKANKVSINAGVETSYYTLNDDLLRLAIAKKMQATIKDNKKLDTKSMKYVVEEAEKNDNEIALTLKMKGKVYKEPATDQIQNKLSFKNTSQLEKTLRGFGVVSAAIKNAKPGIPFLSSFTPLFQKNISVEVQPE